MAPRKSRRKFQLAVRSLWNPEDWSTGAAFTVGGAGPGKGLVNRVLRDVKPPKKKVHEMDENQTIADVLIERVHAGESARDVVLEATHWPAVPTYHVVTKPKPTAAPKPAVSPTAHASMPKPWGK